MKLGQNLVDIAVAELHNKEIGDNSGPAVRKYQAATVEAPGRWPWCAAFVAWCIQQAGYPDGQRFKSALAYDLETWGLQQNGVLLTEYNTAQPGDLVTYDFSHCGIVEFDRGDQIAVIEGNTNDQGAREGDGVYRRYRDRRLVRRFVRISA